MKIDEFEKLADAFNKKYRDSNDAAKRYGKDGWKNERDWAEGYAAGCYEAAGEIRKLLKKIKE